MKSLKLFNGIYMPEATTCNLPLWALLNFANLLITFNITPFHNIYDLHPLQNFSYFLGKMRAISGLLGFMLSDTDVIL